MGTWIVKHAGVIVLGAIAAGAIFYFGRKLIWAIMDRLEIDR